MHGSFGDWQREKTATARKPDQIDQAVAERVRAFRRAKSLTQARIAERVGVTTQQIQKYELAQNRIPASHLYKMAQVLGVPVQCLFERVQVKLSPEESISDVSSLIRDASLRPLLISWQRLEAENKKLILKLLQRLR